MWKMKLITSEKGKPLVKLNLNYNIGLGIYYHAYPDLHFDSLLRR